MSKLVGVHMSGLFTLGSTIEYSGTDIPAGYLVCNGALVSRATYADLFAKIGTKYGPGDGSTTFALPKAPVENFTTRLGHPTPRAWVGITVAQNGDVYASTTNGGGGGGDIYKQTGGVGSFVGLGGASRDWAGMATAANGDIYCCVPQDSIYKSTGGGAFTSIGETARYWYDIAAGLNGDLYAVDYSGDIYRRAGGVGSFVALGTGMTDWTGITVAPNGDVYATRVGQDIYKQTGGVGSFIDLNQTHRPWYGIFASKKGDVYAGVGASSGDIYKQSGGVGDFVAMGFPQTLGWYKFCQKQNDDIYALAPAVDIFVSPSVFQAKKLIKAVR